MTIKNIVLRDNKFLRDLIESMERCSEQLSDKFGIEIYIDGKKQREKVIGIRAPKIEKEKAVYGGFELRGTDNNIQNFRQKILLKFNSLEYVQGKLEVYKEREFCSSNKNAYFLEIKPFTYNKLEDLSETTKSIVSDFANYLRYINCRK